MAIFTDEQREDVVDYLVTEYQKAESERTEKKEKWRKYRRQRIGEREYEVKNYPWPKSSNVSPPLASINGNNLFGKLEDATRVEPFWAITSMNSEEFSVQDAELLEKYFQLTATNEYDLNIPEVKRVVNYEAGTMGTCWVKVPWETVRWTVRTEDETGVPTDQTVTLHDGPSIIPLQLEDVRYLDGYDDVDLLPWISCDVHLSWPMLKTEEASGVYENVDEVEGFYRSSPLEHEAEASRLGGVSRVENATYDISDFNFFWDIDGTGNFQDCTMSIHIPSKTVLAEGYNPTGRRPYRQIIWMIKPFELEGRGTGQLVEYLQDEADMIHNSRNNNMHIANMRMFAVRRGIGIKTKEHLYPGKIFHVDSPKDDIATIQAGEIYPSYAQAEAMTMAYARQNTNMDSISSGFADQTMKTRDSIGLASMRTDASRGMFGSVLDGAKQGWADIGLLVFYQLVANRKLVIQRETEIKRLKPEEIDRLEKILSVPVAKIPTLISFTLKAIDIEQSFENKRQNMLAMFTMYGGFVDKVMPLVQVLFGPQAAQIRQAMPDMYFTLTKFYTGFVTLMEGAFEFFGEDKTDKLFPVTKKLEAMNQMYDAFMGNIKSLGDIQNAGTNDVGPGLATPFGEPGGPVGAGAVGDVPGEAGGGGQGFGQQTGLGAGADSFEQSAGFGAGPVG
jgi:hypothetical protein